MLEFHSLKVKSRSEVAEDAVCIAFEVPQALRERYRFEAGQHVTVRAVRDGEDVRRTYSIVCPADERELRIGVRVQPGGRMSPWLAEELELGATLDVLTPSGSFHTRIEPGRAKRYVAFAAGSGITPVLCIAAAVLAQEPLSSIVLFYGNRTIASTMFAEEVLALKNRYPTRFAVHFVMSREPQDVEMLNGRLDAKKVRRLAGALFHVDAVDEFFICGPGSMVEDVRTVLRELGATGRIHTELFATAERPCTSGVRKDVVATRQEQSQVTVIMDGRRRSFSMARNGDESVLEAAERAGIELPYSCRAGVCSTCRAKVSKGAVTMSHDQALEAWEIDAGYVLCCQSRPTTEQLELTYDE